MPTPVNPSEKANFIAIVQAGPLPTANFEVGRLATILNYYEDIPMCIGRQLETFATYPAYLREALGVFTDSDLVAVGIYNNKLPPTPAPSPDAVLVANSDYTGVNMLLNTDTKGLVILNSKVGAITVAAGVKVDNIYIGPGSVVNKYDGSAGSTTNLWMPFFRNTPSTLYRIRPGTTIKNFYIDDGSYFGGYAADDPNAICALPVTGISATQITDDSVSLNWTPPASGYLSISVDFKQTQSAVWTPADQFGYYVGSTGFVFTELERDTYYDFRINVTCNNGGINSTTVSAKTVCCGSSSAPLTLIYSCEIVALIVNAPNPANTQTLCNGSTIAKEYPPGPTLTIPLLIGMASPGTLVVNGTNYQQFPFNPATGTFNASTTPLGNFNPGFVVTFKGNVPA